MTATSGNIELQCKLQPRSSINHQPILYIALSEDPGELSKEDPPADALSDDHPFTEQVEIKEDKGHIWQGDGQ